MRFLFLIFSAFLVPTTVLFCQTTVSPDDEDDILCSVIHDHIETSTISTIGDSSRQLHQEITSLSVEPMDFLDKNRTMLTIGGSLAITAALFATDQTTYNSLYLWKMNHHFVDQASPIITNLGDGKTSLVLFGGAFAYSFAFGDKGAKEIGTIGLESFVLSSVATLLLKLTFSREQPNVATRRDRKSVV